MFNKFLIIFCITSCCLLVSIGSKAEPVAPHQNAQVNSATVDPNDGVPPFEISKGVNAVHVFVCLTLNNISLPSWLDNDSLIKTGMSYRGNLGISSKVTADVRPCKEQSNTKDSNEMNVVLSLTGQQQSHSSGHSDLAILQRSFYRPTSVEGGKTFQTKPFVLDLSDEKAAYHEFQLWNWYWADSRRHNDPLNLGTGFKLK